MSTPQVTHCPYCGNSTLKLVNGVPRCMTCRAAFFVSFSRYVRRSPASKRHRAALQCQDIAAREGL